MDLIAEIIKHKNRLLNLLDVYYMPKALVREKLTGNRTYYVTTTGSDSNDGLSSSTPFLTLQKAWDVLSMLDLNNYTITVDIGDGTYTAGINTDNKPQASGLVVFDGNSGTPANVIISTTSANCFNCISQCNITVQNMELRTTTTGHELFAGVVLSQIRVGVGMRFGTSAQSHMRAAGGKIVGIEDYDVVGGGSVHVQATLNGVVEMATVAATTNGTFAFTQSFARTDMTGVISYFSSSFTVVTGAVTGQRYNASTNGVINTFGGGANYFPGDVAGATATGGQYG